MGLFIVALGFLSGLWLSVGIDPSAISASALAGTVNALVPGPSLLVWLGAALFLGFALAVAFDRRGLYGLAVVGLGFLGGALILVSLVPGAILIGVGLVLGLFI